jgi:CelD/BcsL family acetyltransferase involved in cellulose biosynthesis
VILQTSDPVCIARDPASLVTKWSELARRRAPPSIFLTPEWLAVARAHDARAQLTLTVADGGIVALARDDDGTLSFAGGEYTDEQDVVAAPSEARFVAEAFAEWVADQATPHAVFASVPEETPTARALSAVLGRRGYTVGVTRQVTSPRLDLPNDFEAYVQGLTKKDRHELRRKIRRLETGRRVTFSFAPPAARAEILDRFFELHRRSRGEKAHFMTPENERFFRDVADSLAVSDRLRLGVLDVDGDRGAVLFGFAFEGTLALWNAAYDPALAALSVGIVSHAYAVRAAIADGMRTYDLLQGDEPYKYDLGADDRWLVRVEATSR